MKLFPNRQKLHRPAVRMVAGILLPCIFVVLAPVDLIAQTYRSYEESKLEVDRYFDRAERMQDRDAWSNYVELGVATERIEWERDALEELQAVLENIEEVETDEASKKAQVAAARAEFEQAGEDWQIAADEDIAAERGRFTAKLEAVAVAEVSDQTYLQIIAAVEAAIAADASLELDGWEAVMAGDRAGLRADFETELASENARARANQTTLTGAELAAFEDELDRVSAELRAEFDKRENFYVSRARNRFIALKRGDDLNARLATDEGAAINVTEDIIADTLEQLDKDTTDLLNSANDELQALATDPSDPNFDSASVNWEARMESVIDSGLRAWERAEEDLFARRLNWEREADTTREQGEAIWEAQYRALMDKRDEWLDAVQNQIKAGRDQWAEKLTEFQESRTAAEQELAEYVTAERERRNAASGELREIIEGGGSALLEAKDAYRYYQSLMDTVGEPGPGAPADNVALFNFYRDQRDRMATAVVRFQSILGGTNGAEAVLTDMMHSDANHTGLLNDRRLFAGDLPERIAGIEAGVIAGTFEEQLTAMMAEPKYDEDFTLYRRDIGDLIDRNAAFARRAGELAGSSDFDYGASIDKDSLLALVGGLDREYSDHGTELAAIVNRTRDEAIDSPEWLAAVQADISAYLTAESDRDARLQRETVAYFNEGLGGYYLSGNESDPYLMTQAQYEWELLRRERDQLAKNLRKAQEVKEYADLAFQFSAGLELAALTRERSEVYRIRASLPEIGYRLIKGDYERAPEVFTSDAARDARFTEILSEFDIDPVAIAEREGQLATELSILDDLSVTDRGSARAPADLIADIDAYLQARWPDSGGEASVTARAEHSLGILREKLAAYKQRLDAGAPAAELDDLWTAFSGASGLVKTQTATLAGEYNFSELSAELDDLRTNKLREPALGDYRRTLAVTKAEIEANAVELAAAHERLEAAKTAYREARIDFDVIRAGNSIDLIKKDLQNTTGALASVLNRMGKLEGDLASYGYRTPVEAGRIEYLDLLSNREEALYDQSLSNEAYEYARGIKAAQERRAALETLLGQHAGTGAPARYFEGASAEDVITAFVNAKADLIGTDDEATASSQDAQTAMAVLEGLQSTLTDLAEELAQAETPEDPDGAGPEVAPDVDPTQVALLKYAIQSAREEVFRQAETLTAAIRGEEDARREHLLYYLDKSTGGVSAADMLKNHEETLESEETALRDEAFAAAQTATAAIKTFLSDNHKKADGTYRSFTELLKLANADAATEFTDRAVTATDGYGRPAGDPGYDRDLAAARIMRAWLVSNRATIEAAGSGDGTTVDTDSGDERTVADRWTALLEGLDKSLASAGAYADFESTLPADESASEVVALRDELTSLEGTLNTLLAGPDSGLAAGVTALGTNDRERLKDYGDFRSAYARESLQALRDRLSHEIDALGDGERWEDVWRGERARLLENEITRIAPDLSQKQSELLGLRIERGDLTAQKTELADELTAGGLTTAQIDARNERIAALDDRLSVIETRTGVLTGEVSGLAEAISAKSALMNEAQSPGSSVPFVNEAFGELYLSFQGTQMTRAFLAMAESERFRREIESEPANQEPAALEKLLGAMGIYATDPAGALQRDAAGQPVPTQLFTDLGLAPGVDVAAALAGDRKGSELETVALSLLDALGDPAREQYFGAELAGSKGALENALRDYLAAVEIINHRGESTGTISAAASAESRQLEGRLAKLAQFQALYDSINQTLDTAAQQGGDPAGAVLALLGKPENIALLRIFGGYDTSGQTDDIVDPDMAARVAELLDLAERLRENRRENYILSTAGVFAQSAGAWANTPDPNDTLIFSEPNAGKWREAIEEIQADTTVAAIQAMPVDPNDELAFRAGLSEWLITAPDKAAIFAEELAGILARSTDEGQALKDEVALRMQELESEMTDRLTALNDDALRIARRDRDLVAAASVADLIARYAVRADTVKSALLTTITDLDTAQSTVDAQTALRTAVAALAAGEDTGATASIRRDLLELIDGKWNPTDPEYVATGVKQTISQAEIDATLDAGVIRSRLLAYLNALENPDAAGLDGLKTELYERDLLLGLTNLATADEFKAEDYPAELQGLLLTREYQRAQKRIDEYDTASGNPDTAEDAALDLSGINGQIARYFLTTDFGDWSAGRSLTDFKNEKIAAGEAYSIAGYLEEYLEARGTDSSLLPGGARDLLEQQTLGEYQRLRAAIDGGQIAALDENDYPAELRAYLLSEKFKEYANRTGLALSGATVGARYDNFDAQFEAFLTDANGSVGGKNLNTRLLNSTTRDRLFAQAFAMLESGANTEDLLPAVFSERIDAGTLADPIENPESFLPAELTAITDYATADYHTMAAAVSSTTRVALARIELNEELGATELDLGLSLSDADLAQLVSDSGAADLPADARNALVELARRINQAAAYGGASSSDEAVAMLRSDRALREAYPTAADQAALSNFYAREGARLSIIEETYFTELAKTSDRLRELARNDRGEFLRAMIAVQNGGTTAYRDGLTTGERDELDALATKLYSELDQSERDALDGNPAEYQAVFALHSSQELVTSGLFEAAEAGVLGLIETAGTAAQREAAKERRPELLRALFEQVYADAGTGSLSAATTSFLADTGLTALIERAASAADPDLRAQIEINRALIDRFLTRYQETTAERLAIDEIFENPELLNPSLPLSLDYELGRGAALAASETNALTGALYTTIAALGRDMSARRTEYERESHVQAELMEYARLHDDQPMVSRFSNYRSYLGTENIAIDETNAANDGMLLESQSLGLHDPESLFADGSYTDLLTSDSAAAGSYYATPDYEGKVVKTVSSIHYRGPGSDEDEMRRMAGVNLANNYLEKVSRLNEALSSFFVAAQMADDRKAAEADTRARLAAAYADSDTIDITSLENEKVDAQSRVAQYSQAKISEKQSEIAGAEQALKDAGRDFAGAGRRNQLRNMALTGYLDQVFTARATELNAAEADYNTFSDIAAGLRDKYAAQNQDHVNALNEMAERYREMEKRTEDFELREAVKEYAETPYLYASMDDAETNAEGTNLKLTIKNADGTETVVDVIDEYRGDAQDEYDRALAAYDAAQRRLKDAGYRVQIEGRLEDFNTVLGDWEAGGRSDATFPELTDDEKEELTTLREKQFKDYTALDTTNGPPSESDRFTELANRELYNQYKTLFPAQAEHIKHTMRMVRLHKANELIQEEIRRRRMVAEEKKKQFENTLNAKFGYYDKENGDGSTNAGWAARNAVYARLAGRVETGASMWDELRGWYWQGSRWADETVNSWVGQAQQTGTMPLLSVTINQVFEGILGNELGSQINRTDQNAIGIWMSTGGTMAEWSGFSSIYFSFIQSLGIRDLKYMELQITKGVYEGPRSQGKGMMDTGKRIKFGGQALVNAGKRIFMPADGKIKQAEMAYQLAEVNRWIMYDNQRKAATDGSVRATMDAQREYEEALAALYYFTRADSMQTLKERMIQYGQQNAYQNVPGENYNYNLYDLTEEDLNYLWDQIDGYEQSNGGQVDAATQTEISPERLDITDLKEETEYRDSFGRRYDPRTYTDSQPGPLEGGYYIAGDGTQYTRVKSFTHNGNYFYRYYRSISDDDGQVDKVYDLGEVLASAVPHGAEIEADRKQKYLAAGNALSTAAGDDTFILTERDQTFQRLFERAASYAEGGREFTGYRETFATYSANAALVMERELAQRTNTQQKEWDLREQDLRDKIAAWEQRAATIQDRGRKLWASSESQFLQKWREWRKETDDQIKEGKAVWDAKVKEHETAQLDWENKVRQKAAETTIEHTLNDTINELNAQLVKASKNIGGSFDKLDRIKVINDAVEEARRGLPSGTERIKSINEGIKKFNTNLSLSQMTGANFNLDTNTIGRQFRTAMEENQNNMRILANTQVMRQYMDMLEEYKDSITVQNQQVEDQTRAAAMAAGYTERGGQYIKEGVYSESYSAVDKYKWFDVNRAFDEELNNTGLDRKTGKDLVSFLENQSTVEVESYFYAQRLAVQVAIDNIVGRDPGNENSQDAKVIGRFGVWVGKPGAETAAAAQAAMNVQNMGTDDKNRYARDYTIETAAQGFGELGSMGKRPGGAPMGFYPQLKWFGEYVNLMDQKAMEEGKDKRKYRTNLSSHELDALKDEYTPESFRKMQAQMDAFSSQLDSAKNFDLNKAVTNNYLSEKFGTNMTEFNSMNKWDKARYVTEHGNEVKGWMLNEDPWSSGAWASDMGMGGPFADHPTVQNQAKHLGRFLKDTGASQFMEPMRQVNRQFQDSMSQLQEAYENSPIMVKQRMVQEAVFNEMQTDNGKKMLAWMDPSGISSTLLGIDNENTIVGQARRGNQTAKAALAGADLGSGFLSAFLGVENEYTFLGNETTGGIWTSLMNTFNPFMWEANERYAVRTAEYHGQSKAQAQRRASMETNRAVLKAAATAAIIAATAGTGTVAVGAALGASEAAAAAVGAAVMATGGVALAGVANSMYMANDGTMMLRMDDRAAIATAATAVGAYTGVYGSQEALAAANGATSLIQGGMDYNERGQATWVGYGGANGDRFLRSAAIGGIGAMAGLAGGYAALSSGMSSGMAAVISSLSNTFGSEFANIAAAHAMGDDELIRSINNRSIAGGIDLTSGAILSAWQASMNKDWSDSANDTNRNRTTAEILLGLGYDPRKGITGALGSAFMQGAFGNLIALGGAMVSGGAQLIDWIRSYFAGEETIYLAGGEYEGSGGGRGAPGDGGIADRVMGAEDLQEFAQRYHEMEEAFNSHRQRGEKGQPLLEDYLKRYFSEAEILEMKKAEEAVSAHEEVLKGMGQFFEDTAFSVWRHAAAFSSLTEVVMNGGKLEDVAKGRIAEVDAVARERMEEKLAPITAFLEDKSPAFKMAYLMKMKTMNGMGEVAGFALEMLLTTYIGGTATKAGRVGKIFFKNPAKFRRAASIAEKMTDLANVRRIGTYGPEVSEIAIGRLNALHDVPRRGVPDGHIADIAESIRKNGFDLSKPISATRLPNGDLLITGGHHRLAALQKLNQRYAPVKLYDAQKTDPIKMAQMLEIGKTTGKYNSSWYPKLTPAQQSIVKKYIEAWRRSNGY